jgi:hypothetical protein
MPKVLIKRGTRSQLDTAKTASGLNTGELYLITDESKVAVGTAVNAYAEVQKQDADLDAIAALTGTSGLLKKTAADTWALDTNTYLTSAVTSVTGTAPIVSSGGNTPAISISVATTSAAGSMSASDKTKLDGIASGATANTGTVTSVGLSLPALFTVSGSPVTTSGTLSATLASQTANFAFIAPEGAAGAPTFRQLQMTDIPGAAYKRSVRVATTAAITLSGTQTIDGVAVVAGDRVLVKDQATAATNGIYVVAAGAWTRSLDADTIDEIASALVPVDSGTTNGGKVFDNDLKTTDALGTTAMTWGRILDTGALASVAPLASGTAAVGTSELAARQDHVHPISTLTLGTGLSGTSYNGSAEVTAAVSYGTTATTACVGNDSRLSDTRNTTNSITFNTTGGAAAGTTFNGSAARTIDYSTVGAAASSHTHSYLPLAGGTMTGAITFAGAQTWPTFNQNTTGSAATLTTARTLTIGATGKTFNGSANVSWTLAEIGAAVNFTVTTTATSKTIVAEEACFVTAAGQTITLPASPTANDIVIIGVNNFTNTVIGRNAVNIMSLAENMTIDSPYVTVTLMYVNATIGWKII